MSFLFFLAAFVSSLLLTGLVLHWLRHKQILDIPNERSSHDMPTPRGGGWAIVLTVLAGWGGFAAFGGASGLWPLLVAALVLALVSWKDDKGHIPPFWRLLAQSVTVAVGLFVFPSDVLFFQGIFPLMADRLLAFFAWLWFVNLFNFMDGTDGFAATEALCIALGASFLLTATGGIPAIVLAGAAGGFLVWNWSPAKVFMGDVGSITTGYLLGFLMLVLAGMGHWAAALILPAYFWTDASITLARRALRKEKIWQPHREHFYQKAVQAGQSHAGVAETLFVGNVILVLLALGSVYAPWISLAAAVGVVGGMLLKMGNCKLSKD